jgi:RNA polymerase sigma factor (sigma-70 family)
MPTSPLAPLLRRLRGGADPPGLTDAQLLELFLLRRDEDAFEALVRRHGPMVLGVCRRVLGNTHDAEDAFQATFLVLAQKASSVAPREMVGNWLYGVARRTALKAKGLAARRRAKERQVRDIPRPEPPDPDAWDDLRARLDAELVRLPTRYRAAVVLCHLEGLPRHEAARRLGLAEGTLSSRLNRGRRLLARRLARGGPPLPAGALAAALSGPGASAAVPAPLVLSTVHAAVLVAAGRAVAAVAPAEVAALTKGVLQAMSLDKLKGTLALVLAAVVLGVGTLAAPTAARPGPPDAPAGALARDDKPGPEKKEKPAPDQKAAKPSPDKRGRAEEVVTKSFKTKAAPRLVVETFNGHVAVKTGAPGTTTARVVKSAQAATREAAAEVLKTVDVELKQEGDMIRVAARAKGEQKRQTSRGAAVEVEVPPGARLDLRSSNGKVTVAGATGEVVAATSNGGVEVKGSKGALRLKTSNGGIRVEGGSGTLDLHTNNGRIDVKATKAKVTAQTSNGSVRFAGSLADGEHSFQTSNGGLTLTLPADSRFRLDAQTSNGRATCRFPHKPTQGKVKTRLRATVGEDPAVSLKLRASNGSIEVRPEKPGEE